MKQQMSNIIVCALALTLAACASAPAMKKVEGSTADIKPSYSEKVAAAPADKAKVSVPCPASPAQWENQDWKKVAQMANACVKAGDWYKVETIGNYLSVKASLTPWGPYYLGLAANFRKDHPRAIWMLELALKKNPNEGLFQYELGRIAWDMGDETQAKQRLKAASDLSPGLTEAHWVLGQIAVDANDFSQAESRLKKALESDSRHWPSLMSMAALKMKTKSWEEAEDYLAKAVDQNPRSAKARLALAQVQEQHLKKFREAINGYKELRQLTATRRLDEAPTMNFDQKIKDLEKSLPEFAKKAPANQREPSAANGKVQQ